MEIKFRGQTIGSNEWIYGDLLHKHWIGGDKFNETSIRYLIDGIYSFPIQVKPETVGQFTGLKDKNGTDIYCGDICTFKSYSSSFIYTGVVVYEEENMRYVFEDIYKTFYRDKSSTFIKRDKVTHHSFEVIGNIHTNPELTQK